MDFFIQGLIIGFAIAVPVGPIGVLCIQRSLGKGRLSGLSTGLGAATADAFYGAVAGFGLVAISDFLIQEQAILKIIGGLFLLYLGVKSFLSKPNSPQATEKNKDLISDYLSTIFLTLANPTTIVSFLAIFAGVGLVTQESNYSSASYLVLGVFLGSAFWWLILSSVTGLLRNKIGNKTLKWINRASGLFITSIGLYILFI